MPQEESPQRGSARGNPSQVESPQPRSARGNPSQVTGSNQAVFAMLPPIDDDMRSWAERLKRDVPELDVVVPEDEGAAQAAIARADAAYGWVSPEQLPNARSLRWLQNPFAGPFPGYYYQGLIDHPVTITNPRGIYSDHIAHHIVMFMLALSRGLPYWLDAQRQSRWDRGVRKHGYVNVVGSTVLVNGVGGIGAETARLATALGANVVGIDPRPEHDCPATICIRRPTSTACCRTRTSWSRPSRTRRRPSSCGEAERFRAMKRSAYFINIGRGMTAKLDDLTAALQAGEIAGAGLDVFEIEPLPAEHPLWHRTTS